MEHFSLKRFIIAFFVCLFLAKFAVIGNVYWSNAITKGFFIAVIFEGIVIYLKSSKRPEPEPEPAPENPYPPRPIFKKFIGGEHGTARLYNPELIAVHHNGGGYEGFLGAGDGYYVGAGYNISELMHGVTVAGSGQGKGTCLIIPNLLRFQNGNASWFVLDPKGENAIITAKWQQNNDQNVVILDPWNEQKRLGATHGIEPMGFNPLMFVKGNPDEMPESCGVIADMLVPDGDDKDPYWNSRAKSLIKTYLLHLVTAGKEDEQHLGTLYKWLRLNPIDRAQLWDEMLNNPACDELVKFGINEFIGLDPDRGPLPSIISTAQDNTVFLESGPLRASLSKNDFDPYELTNGQTTLYLCLPERFLKTHSRWLRIVVGVCLKACNYRPNKRVNFILDEFALLGKMHDVENAFAFARGQKISVWIFVQSLSQLNKIYGENGASAFLANARLRQFFGVFDYPTQKYVSDYLGEMTVETINKTESSSSGGSSGMSSTSAANGGSTGSSSGTNWSSSSSTSRQKIARKILTPEEVGKSPYLITFIDTYKYFIPKIPYFGSIYQNFEDGTYMPFPLTDESWHSFLDVYRAGMKNKDWYPDFGPIYKPRAYKGELHPHQQAQVDAVIKEQEKQEAAAALAHLEAKAQKKWDAAPEEAKNDIISMMQRMDLERAARKRAEEEGYDENGKEVRAE